MAMMMIVLTMMMTFFRQVIPENVHVSSESASGSSTTGAAVVPRRMFEHFQEIDAKDHLGKWYQAFVIETTDDGIAVHFSGWSQIWDEFVPTSQITKRVRSRSMHTETGEDGPETVAEVRTRALPAHTHYESCLAGACSVFRFYAPRGRDDATAAKRGHF